MAETATDRPDGPLARAANALRVTSFNLAFYGWTFVIALTCYGYAKLSTRERMQRVFVVWARGVLAAMRVLLGARVEIRGREKLPKEGGLLLVSKHQSELDVVLLGLLFPNTSGVAMAELSRYPFFGPILRKAGIVSVAVEKGPQGRTQQVIDGARRVVLEERRPMIIYPEGELMMLGARERYRKGAAHIYVALDVPAYPIAASLGVIWPQRRWTKHVGKTGAIEFLDPVEPGLSFDAFLDTVEERIEQATMRLIREHACGEVLAAAEDRFARRVNNRGEQVARTLDSGEGVGQA